MDSYAINNTIDQGHAMTQSNMDYNQRVASARNQIQDTFNQTSKQDKTTQDRDKDIYLKNGRFGPYLQYEIETEEKESPYCYDWLASLFTYAIAGGFGALYAFII